MNAPALRERLAATPRLACENLVRAINARDLERALECFAPGACLIGPDGSFAQGAVAVRACLVELINAGAQIEIELFGVLIAEELALAHERWTILYDGRPSHMAQSAHPTLVLRLLEGEWKLTIAAPWGTSASPPLEAVWP